MYTYVLIHVVVWQKPTQHCKTIILKLKFFKNLIIRKRANGRPDDA